MLKKPKLVVFDEVNARLDPSTAQMMMESCEKVLRDSVLLFIVHRVETILHFDRVIVLDRGRIVEMASPYELITREDSQFSQMLRSKANSLLTFSQWVAEAREFHNNRSTE